MDKELMDKSTMDKELMDKELMNKSTMEECIICFDETDQFIVFICNHKTCEKCYPLIMEQRPNCPLCNRSLVNNQIRVTPIRERVIPIQPRVTCNLCVLLFICGSLLFYIVAVGGSTYFKENNKL